MREMQIDDLRRILVQCAGESDSAAFANDITSVSFEDLGYDSLALMETAARISQEFGVTIRDEEIIEARTPGEIIALVNGAAVVLEPS